MGAAHAAAGSQRPTVRMVVLVDQGQYLVNNVAVVIFLPLCPQHFVPVVIGPAFPVNRIYAEQLQLSVINKFGQLIDHSEIFVVIAQ